MMASFCGTEQQGNMSHGLLTLQLTIKIHLFFGVLALEMVICVTRAHPRPAYVSLSLVLPSLPDSEKTLHLLYM